MKDITKGEHTNQLSFKTHRLPTSIPYLFSPRM